MGAQHEVSKPLQIAADRSGTQHAIGRSEITGAPHHMRLTKKLLGTFASILFVTACTDLGSSTSAVSGADDGGVTASDDCTLTQGYWKNHLSAWPVSSLDLGNVTYTKPVLVEILKTPVKGNGLISLAHQLIAAKLNIAAGASSVDISVSIAAADAVIGDLVVGEDELSTSVTAELVGKLDAFNSGNVGPGHCGDNDNDHGDDHERSARTASRHRALLRGQEARA